jgi:uncharacterized protein YjlB
MPEQLNTKSYMMKILQYFLKDDGQFPNSHLPVLLYKHAIKLPLFFKGRKVKALFQKHQWTNNWRNGIFTFPHYHSNTHEVMAVISGRTLVRVGGDHGMMIRLEKGDVILIPAGVAHQNMRGEDDVVCIGGYPQGKDYDMNYGKKEERPAADEKIAKVKLPKLDPVNGKNGSMHTIWNKYTDAVQPQKVK